jgi:hypothetical protein
MLLYLMIQRGVSQKRRIIGIEIFLCELFRNKFIISFIVPNVSRISETSLKSLITRFNLYELQ